MFVSDDKMRHRLRLLFAREFRTEKAPRFQPRFALADVVNFVHTTVIPLTCKGVRTWRSPGASLSTLLGLEARQLFSRACAPRRSFERQLALVLLDKGPDLVSHIQDLVPSAHVHCDRPATGAMKGNCPFLANLQRQRRTACERCQNHHYSFLYL